MSHLANRPVTVVIPTFRCNPYIRRAVESISGSMSTPTVWIPLRASSMATRPVPQPASRTVAGPREATRVASPCLSGPVVEASARRRS